MDINTLLLIIVMLAQAVLALSKVIGLGSNSKKTSSSNGNGNGRKPLRYVIPGTGEKCIQHEGRIIKLEEQNVRGREDYRELKREMNEGFSIIYRKLDAMK